MRFCNVASSFLPTLTALFSSTQLALLSHECLLRSAVKARILYCITLAISQEDLQPNINPNGWMLTRRGSMFIYRLNLTDDQSIPVPISTMHQMNGLRLSLNRTMQLDLEEVTKFL